MTILDNLNNKNIWNEFYEYKTSKNLLSELEKQNLKKFIDNEEYLKIANEIINGTYIFSIPQKKLINKIDSNKKRIIYTYQFQEMMILKLISYLLYKYDYKLSSNCYSFRLNYGVKDAIYKLVDTPNISNLYGYKIDISNYFNSIPIEKLLPKLEEILNDDIPLYNLLKQILTSSNVLDKGNTIIEKKGIMAGVPISAFLANVYLLDIDNYFKKNNILYARYSDDIILFSNKNNIKQYELKLKQFLFEYGLKINTSKQSYFLPNDKWNFLGFSYENGKIDLADIAIKKIKRKIKRSAKSIRRWMLRKKVNPDIALKLMNNKFNYKFYSNFEIKELCWIKWYFPIINTSKSLKQIDNYMQEELRFIVTGKHNKKNYQKVPYSMLKKCNYKPLVHEFYKYKNSK